MTISTFCIVGNLDNNTVASVIDLAGRLAKPALDPSAAAITELLIPISSVGGDIGAAIATYNILRSIRLPITTHNIGEVGSAANIVFLAGEKRLACKHSYFRHHGTLFGMQGTSHQKGDALEVLNAGEEIMMGIMVERTNLTAEQVKTYFHNPVTMNPQTALMAGIIHEIREIS
jgi:ATP-dependent protease ClpP protease subunit